MVGGSVATVSRVANKDPKVSKKIQKTNSNYERDRLCT
ncbi:MAG: LacI family DNA-binding transcriptional regulator [Colwellia sp.]